MPDPNTSEEEREHLRSLAEQAKSELLANGAKQEEHGYDLPTPPAPDEVPEEGEEGEEPPADDKRQAVVTAFLVFVDPSTGRAIATSDIEETMAVIKVEKEASLVDLRRYLAEALDDVRIALQTQNNVQAQMQVARQMQEQMQAQQVAAGLDLSKMRSRT